MIIDILLVEDDELLRRALSYWLTFAGYRVTQAANGEAAIDLLEHTAFAVVLTDIVMGDVDGIEVLHTARRMAQRPAVILLTGHGSLETAVAAVRAGAHDYLIKPYDEDALLECVRSAAARFQAEQRVQAAARVLVDLLHPGSASTAAPGNDAPGTTIRVGAITIGTSRKQVWFEQRPVQLTPIEYTLLCQLAERPGQVQRYSAIARHTHQLELDEAEAKGLLRTHFLNLRKKLDPRYFSTDRGIGYILEEPGARG